MLLSGKSCGKAVSYSYTKGKAAVALGMLGKGRTAPARWLLSPPLLGVCVLPDKCSGKNWSVC